MKAFAPIGRTERGADIKKGNPPDMNGKIKRFLVLCLAAAMMLSSCGGNTATTPDPTETNITETNMPETTAPETTAPETAAPETTAPETAAPETAAPETAAPETAAPETAAPETAAPETAAPETAAPETAAPETAAPETAAPETAAPETAAPETAAPETAAPETAAPETAAPETAAPETAAPETAAPETAAPETAAPETAAPETVAPETQAPVADPVYGDCGNIYWTDPESKVGQLRLDAFKHQVAQINYSSKVTNGTVTVEEDSGIFEIHGWVGMNFSDFELGWRIGTNNVEQYTTRNIKTVAREGAVYAAAQSEGFSNATGFIYYLNTSDFKSGDEIHLFLKDKATGNIYCFFEIVVIIDSPAVNVDPAIIEKYELGNGSTMDMSAYDPIPNKETVTAPNDDPTLELWFDHLTEKVARYDLSGRENGKKEYTIQMGKNEIEGCQFFLYSPTPRKIEIKVSDFTNDKGETLTTELGVEYYIEDGYLTYNGSPEDFVYPDAVVPYDSYIAYAKTSEFGAYGTDAKNRLKYGKNVCIGPFSASPTDLANYPYRDSIRGFVIEAGTTKDTTPGAYKATIEIIDADTNEVIKMANVYTYVYNVTLSDETALDTCFNLWDIYAVYKNHYTQYPKMTAYSSAEITNAVANFFLKQRITVTGGLTFFDELGVEWFKNPRVTTVRVLTKSQYDRIKDNPILAEKMFYYGQDEPAVPRGWRPIGWPDGTSETVYDNTGLLSVLAIAREVDMLKNDWGWEDYRMVIPFERTIDFTAFDLTSLDKTTGFPAWYEKYAFKSQLDSIEYLADYVNVWTYVYTGATPRELKDAVIGDLYMQTENQDTLLGEFQDRMEQLRTEKGHELWNYVACEPPYTTPYQNILLFNDGTESRTMFWTNYMLNATGFLYWHVSYYDAAGNTSYALRAPFSKTGPGDGILIYPGSAFDQLDPIPSIRLLNMRDGIEEYQMLTMLEAAKGEAYADELVSHIVTSSVTYSRDDDHIYNVRSFLLRALEE